MKLLNYTVMCLCYTPPSADVTRDAKEPASCDALSFSSAPPAATGLYCVGINTEAANMIIYKCLVSGDEMFSDIYKIITTEDGLFYEVEGKHLTRKLGDIDDSLIGGNASAEELAEGTDAAVESGVDIILNHKLTETPAYDKKTFMSYMKSYLKALKEKVQEATPDKVGAFQEEAKSATLKMRDMIAANKDLQFYTGESMNAEGIVGFLDYREDGQTPFMIFMKCGLEIEKC
uniref:Translationally-controlled tumor protein homolog n=1 Tax=Neogobius melanostomus TaxID=47308 RepID=A0A8C6U248_9GOBI